MQARHAIIKAFRKLLLTELATAQPSQFSLEELSRFIGVSREVARTAAAGLFRSCVRKVLEDGVVTSAEQKLLDRVCDMLQIDRIMHNRVVDYEKSLTSPDGPDPALEVQRIHAERAYVNAVMEIPLAPFPPVSPRRCDPNDADSGPLKPDNEFVFLKQVYAAPAESRAIPAHAHAPSAHAHSQDAHWPTDADGTPYFAGRSCWKLDCVGESFRQDALCRLAGGRKDVHAVSVYKAAIIRHEPTNPADRNAMRVEIEGLHVGYLNRQSAKEWREFQSLGVIPDRPVKLAARIKGGWKRDYEDEG